MFIVKLQTENWSLWQMYTSNTYGKKTFLKTSLGISCILILSSEEINVAVGRAEVFDLSSKVLSCVVVSCQRLYWAFEDWPMFHRMTRHKKDKWEMERGKTGERVWVWAFSLRYVAPSLRLPNDCEILPP